MATSKLLSACAMLAGSLIAQSLREPLLGSVCDPAGKPLAGATVEVWRRFGEGTLILDLDYSRTEHLLARMPTDKHGRFAVQLPIGVPCEVRIDQAQHARWIRNDVLHGPELRVQLAAPATFAGRIVLPDGNGAPASLRAFQSEGIELPLGRTDAAGNFRFERLPAGAFQVEVAPDRAAAPAWQQVEFTAGQVLTRDIDVLPGVVLTGKVTDAATGAPIEGALVGEGWTQFKGVRTDRDGRYRLEGFGSRGETDVFCSADGFSRAQRLRPQQPSEPTVMDFALQRGLGATGVVVDVDGKPLPGLYVALLGTVHDGRNQFHDWAAGRTDAEGRFRLQGLREDLPATLMIRGEGRASLVYHLSPPGKDGVMQAGTIVMPVARVVRGRAIDAAGKPIARTKVGLWGTNGDRERMAALPKGQHLKGWELLKSYVALRSVRTDDHGQFAFGDVAPGSYELVLHGERRTETRQLVVEAGTDPMPIEFRQ